MSKQNLNTKQTNISENEKFPVDSLVMPTITTWATYRKKNNPEPRRYQDGTLGIIYSVEPTLLNAGFKKDEIYFGSHSSGVPISFDWDKGSVRQQVIGYIKNHKIISKCAEVVYYTYRVRQEYISMFVEIYYK